MDGAHGTHPEHRVVLAITALTSRPTGAPLTAAVDLLCGFPLDDGRGTVPASVLAKVGELLGGLPVGGGRFFVGAGDWKEFTGNDASYVIEVSRRFESTQPPYTLTGFTIE